MGSAYPRQSSDSCRFGLGFKEKRSLVVERGLASCVGERIIRLHGCAGEGTIRGALGWQRLCGRWEESGESVNAVALGARDSQKTFLNRHQRGGARTTPSSRGPGGSALPTHTHTTLFNCTPLPVNSPCCVLVPLPPLHALPPSFRIASPPTIGPPSPPPSNPLLSGTASRLLTVCCLRFSSIAPRSLPRIFVSPIPVSTHLRGSATAAYPHAKSHLRPRDRTLWINFSRYHVWLLDCAMAERRRL